jgi:hypothetical protein
VSPRSNILQVNEVAIASGTGLVVAAIGLRHLCISSSPSSNTPSSISFSPSQSRTHSLYSSPFSLEHHQPCSSASFFHTTSTTLIYENPCSGGATVLRCWTTQPTVLKRRCGSKWKWESTGLLEHFFFENAELTTISTENACTYIDGVILLD